MHAGNIEISPKHSIQNLNIDFSVNNNSDCVKNPINRNTYLGVVALSGVETLLFPSSAITDLLLLCK